MIAMLQGEVAVKGVETLTLFVHGVGYELTVPARTSAQFVLDETVRLHIAENIREDSYDLFGYATAEERALHFRLVGVQGVGSRLAHAILSVYDAPTLRGLIESEDIVGLNHVSGVGKKTAQRILLDLKGKLVELSGHGAAPAPAQSDPALLALVQLGYSHEQATQTLQVIDPALETSQRVRQALQGLGR